MPDLVTIFEISKESYGDGFIPAIIISIVCFFAGSVGLVAKKISQGRWPKNITVPLCLTCWGLLVCITFTLRERSDIKKVNELLSAYDDGLYEVSEGVVRVFHERIEGIHTKGDIIEIDGQEFEVDYYRSSPAYNRTISHGGVLREGVYAKVYHYKGKILRVGIKETKGLIIPEAKLRSFPLDQIPTDLLLVLCVGTVCIIAENVTYFARKLIVRSHGYSVRFYDMKFRDWKHLTLIAKQAKSPYRRFAYKFINVSVGLFFTLTILMFVLAVLIARS